MKGVQEQKRKEGCCPMILVVDDDAMNHFAMEKILKSLKLKYELAFNGREAISKYKLRIAAPCKNKCGGFKLIITDNNMPLMEGVSATHLIRDFESSNTLARSVIIGCTAYTDKPAEHYVNNGMNDCIFKPVSVSKMKQIIDALSDLSLC